MRSFTLGWVNVYFIPVRIRHKAFIACRVQIVSPYPDLLLRRRQCERSHSGHDIADGFSRLELRDQTMMLRAESCIPVYFGVIEVEDTLLFFDFYNHFIRTGEDFVSECAELVLSAHIVEFVDDGADGRVFIHQDGGDEGFVGEILIAQVQMGLQRSMDMNTFQRQNISYPHDRLR